MEFNLKGERGTIEQILWALAFAACTNGRLSGGTGTMVDVSAVYADAAVEQYRQRLPK